MKAIVLTFDQQAGFAELVVKSYDTLWPSHPFEFLIPYQDRAAVPRHLAEHPRCRLLAAPRGMRGSMEVLVGRLAPSEWVFWAIDDRYPTAAHDVAGLAAVAEAISKGEVEEADGVRLIRWRETLSDRALRIGGRNFVFAEPGQLHGFYLHQFLRAEVLQELFLAPDLPEDYRLREFHDHFVRPGRFARSGRIAVPTRSLLSFGEPCKAGRLVSAAVAHMTALGCPLPDYPVIDGAAVYDDSRRGWP